MGSGFWFRVPCFGFRVTSFGFRGLGFGFRVSGFGFRDPCAKFQVSGFEFRVSCFGFRVSDFGFRGLIPVLKGWQPATEPVWGLGVVVRGLRLWV